MKSTRTITNTIYYIAAIIAVCSSCSFNSPSITIPKTQRLYKHTVEEGFVENLAVFAAFQDEDGINDYKELIIKEQTTGLEWHLNRENTIFLQEQSFSQRGQWVGSNTLTYPRGTFPAGTYTLILSDLGGNTSNYSFTLQKPPAITASPFQFTLNKGHWHIEIHNQTFCSHFTLIMLNADLQPLQIYPLNEKEALTGSIQHLIDSFSDICYIQCFSENSDQSIGFFSTPISLP